MGCSPKPGLFLSLSHPLIQDGERGESEKEAGEDQAHCCTSHFVCKWVFIGYLGSNSLSPNPWS